MKIEDLVLSVDQMNPLKELGLNVKDTVMVRYRIRTDKWGNMVIGKWHIVPSSEIPFRSGFEKIESQPTLILQEILNMLPKEIDGAPMEIGYTPNGYAKPYFIHYFLYGIDYVREEIDVIEICGDTLLECAYKMLVWVIENGYLKE